MITLIINIICALIISFLYPNSILYIVLMTFYIGNNQIAYKIGIECFVIVMILTAIFELITLYISDTNNIISIWIMTYINILFVLAYRFINDMYN